jgi:hypothetical protein
LQEWTRFVLDNGGRARDRRSIFCGRFVLFDALVANNPALGDRDAALVYVAEQHCTDRGFGRS